MYKEKEAFLTFFKGNKRISEKDYLIYTEESRTGALFTFPNSDTQREEKPQLERG